MILSGQAALRDRPANNMSKNIFEYVQEHILICSGIIDAMKDVVTRRMCGTDTIVGLFQAYQDWARGTFDRIMADGLSCQQQIFAATSALTSPPLAPSVSEKKEAAPVQSGARPPASSKAA